MIDTLRGAVVNLYVMHSKLSVKMPLLLKKEGLFENLTVVLYLLPAVACAIAALSLHRNPTVDQHRFVALFYLACAVSSPTTATGCTRLRLIGQADMLRVT